ncbi:hypothetical protein ABW20_dc0101766 [Dactylellina cionopaga]|nr:hypothetical protein ABW20_dc0101766 [Dactylellina cionopaga]
MSGRAAQPPGGPTSQRRDLVYCHQCQNEWYRDQHGLECPSCHSDFTEILETDASDPREDLRLDGFSDDDDDSDDDEFNDPAGHHHHHHHHEHPAGPEPPASGFTLRMGGNTGPSISFRTVRTEFGSGGGSSPGNPFGGHIVGGLNPNPRSPFAGTPFDPHTQSPAARSQGQSPVPPDQSRRPPPAATPNFGNNGSPIAEMFTSIIQNIVGANRDENNPRSPFYQPPPGGFGDARSPAAGQNNPGQGSNQAEGPGFGGPGMGPRSNTGSPLNMPGDPFFMQLPRGRGGGTTYYSSTRTWTGPNGEVRTIRTSSPMPQPGTQGEQPPMDLADILVNIIGASANAGHDDGNGMPPFLRAFGLGHGPTGDYAWSNQDMDRILSQLMDQHQGNAPPPASEDSIKNLPKVKVTQQEVDEGTECVICQDEYKLDEEVVKLPCKHIYHEECVKRWLETHDACPICRTPITPEEQRQRRQTPGGPPGGGPPQPMHEGGGSASASGAGSSGSNMHTASGTGGGNGARWTWSTSFGRG